MADSGDENGTLGDEREGHTEDFGGGGGAARAAQTGDNNPRIFVGNLTQPSSKEAVQALFGQYGGIARVDFKQNFAFVVFDEPESARKAVDTLHDFQQDCGKVLKVEMAVDREKKDRKKDRADNMMTEKPMNRGPVVRLENRVVITGKNGEFPEDLSWKDVKDWAKQATDAFVTYSTIEKDATTGAMSATVEFRDNDRAKGALSTLEATPLMGIDVACKPQDLPADYVPPPADAEERRGRYNDRDRRGGGGGGRGGGRGGDRADRGRGGRGYGGYDRGGGGGGGGYDRRGGGYGGDSYGRGGGGDPYYRGADPRDRGGYHDYDRAPPPRDYPPQDQYYGRGGGGGDPYYRGADPRDRGGGGGGGGYHDRDYDRAPPPRDYPPQEYYGRGGGGDDPYYRGAADPRDRGGGGGGGGYHDRDYDRAPPPRDGYAPRERSRSRDRGDGPRGPPAY